MDSETHRRECHVKRGGRQWIGEDVRQGTMVAGNGRTMGDLGEIYPESPWDEVLLTFLKSRTMKK